MSPTRSLSTALAVLLLAPWTRGQSDDYFTNFETPQVKPITHATLSWASGGSTGAVDVVFVCNTPANFVEAYDAVSLSLLGKVKVGLGPATVRWLPDLGLLYTCNLDGDSVSLIQVTATGPAQLAMRLIRTTHVGDEPADIAVDPTRGQALVTLSGRSSVAIIHPITLEPIHPAVPESILEVAPAAGGLLAVKQPRQIEIGADGRMFVLNHMGDTPGVAGVTYDLDLWYGQNPSTVGATLSGSQLTGLGSTQHAFARTSNGDTMVIVGTSAQTSVVGGEAAVAALPFGFVQSWMWVVDTTAGVTPTVAAPAPAGSLPATALPSLNLNRDYSASMAEVGPADALSQPTDVVLEENAAGDITRIALAAFHSDRLALLTPNPTVFGGYDITRIELPPMAGYSTSGPRGLTIHPNTGRLYVACRLDNSLRVVDPATNSVVNVALSADPTPTLIREGRGFLYSAAFSLTGFVSCASCHVDGRTDGLAWDLSDPQPGQAIPLNLIGNETTQVFQGQKFPDSKGFLVTQTLQGLVNDRVNDEAQLLFTNAPYHWRGDRADFAAFNPAFRTLLRGVELPTVKMGKFTSFINTIRHPPNPEQDLERIVVGPSESAGLANYHDVNVLDGFSCVDCHALPEGSDNVLTCRFFNPAGSGVTNEHPFETAQVRNLFPREFMIKRGATKWVVSNEGISHSGAQPLIQGTIDLFIQNLFAIPANTAAEIAAYVRRFDWGTAPAATFAYTLKAGDPNGNLAMLGLLENQAREANGELAVTVRIGTGYAGLWYDVSGGAYRMDGSSGTFLTTFLSDLANEPDTTVVLQGTPLGDARRYASSSGVFAPVPVVPAPPAPSNITIQPMAPMTYHTDIPLLTGNLHVSTGGVIDPLLSNLSSVWALRTLQLNVAGQFGVSSTIHHEPPRRMRVTGDNLRVGAKLTFFAPIPVIFDLHATGHLAPDGRRIWESEEEMDAFAQFLFLNGETTGTNLYAFRVTNEDGTTSPTVFVPLTIQDGR